MLTNDLNTVLQLLASCSDAEILPVDAMRLVNQCSQCDDLRELETELFECYQDARAGLNDTIAAYIKRALDCYQNENYPLKGAQL